MLRSLLPAAALLLLPLDSANRTWSDGSDDALFGHSVSGAGDINQDGFSDVIVGAPGTSGDVGRAVVYDGHESELVHEWAGDKPGDQFGWSVSSAGDIDNDGFSDLIVGSPGFDEERGRAVIFSGKTGEELYELVGKKPGDRFGFSVSDAGDVNNDGFGDVVIGAPGKDDKKYGEDAGRAYVYSGKKAKLLTEIKPKSESEMLGWSVANAGDVNIDGFGDIVVGAPGAREKKKSPPTGAVRLYHGKKGKLLHDFFGDEEGDHFGHSVHGAGDCNGNGAADIIIGTNSPKPYVRIFDGKKGEELFTIQGDAGLRYGWSVGAAGDYDGDAYSDVVIGAPGDEDGAGEPSVIVISGKTGEVLRKRSSDDSSRSFTDTQLGLSVASAGDLNADSFGEIVVGSLGAAFVFDSKD